MTALNASQELAANIRKSVVRMTHLGKSSHVGSALSMTDMIAVLYANIMNVDPANPKMADRDRFILSKGHAGAAVYAALAHSGFMPVETLDQHYQDGSILSGHVSHKGVPGIELSTGSLGHGLNVAVGMAKGAKLKKEPQRVFCVLSDGECDEGSNWEAIMFAAHHKLNNLTALVDYNKIQSLDYVSETLALEPFADKWKAFGWRVVEVDGHDHEQLATALAKQAEPWSDQPTCVICHTTKGKGVSFMEDSVLWHYRTPQGEEYDAAVGELNDA
ncbi:MAG: transketolase [Gammaproteobacteria bacterium]